MSSVDVVVPCYNYGRFLDQCVASILTQPGVGVRVLIIDDASSDATPAVGQRLAAGDPRIEYRRHDKNLGHIGTYNEGLLGWAAADYCLLLSADDALAPGALARATQLMDQHQEAGFIFGKALVIAEDAGAVAHAGAMAPEHCIMPGADFLQHCFAHGNPVPTPTAIVRTALQHAVGGYRSDLPHTGDMEMWMRLATRGQVAVLRAVQAYYRIHTNNMSSQYYSTKLRDWHEVLRACDEVMSRISGDFPQSPAWIDATRRRIAEDAVRSASIAFNEGNAAECATCLTFAQEVDPRIRQSGIWWKFHAKSFLGQAAWQLIRPTMQSLLRTHRPEAAATLAVQRVGKEEGWWPG